MSLSAPLAGESLLVHPTEQPLQPASVVAQMGRVAVIAPHPDDESLGCGGLLALLAGEAAAAHVFVLTDGSRSHLHSLTHPAARLADLRETETLAALQALGLPPGAVTFLRYGDCSLPAAENMPGFAAAALRLRELLAAGRFDTVVVPWRRDPHCDHQAAWQLARAAVIPLSPRPRWLEYPVWAWMHPTGEAAPKAAEARAWRLDITTVLERKAQAIAQHRSQLGQVIRDDPEGFALQPAMLQLFARPWELFLEPRDG